jgi:cell wall-associated NlpC family hydrolase
VTGALLTGSIVLGPPMLQRPADQPAAAADVPRRDPEPRASRSYRPTPPPEKPKRRDAGGRQAPESSESPPAPRTTAPTLAAVPLNPRRELVVDYALAQVGDPYVWGAAGPDSFDCSGLVLAAFRAAGYAMPRYSGDQHRMGVATSVSQLDRGDLVAWSGHVAIYLGRGMIVEASRSGIPVRVRAFGTAGWFDDGAWGVSLDYSQLPRA